MRIGRYPSGYLELLDAKSNGTTPPDASEFVQPVIDVTAHYALGVQRVATANTGSVATTGFFAAGGSLLIPSGEIWRVRQVHASGAALAAGTTYRIRAGVTNTGLLGSFLLGPDSTSAVATDRPAAVWEPTFELLLGPGWSFGLWCEQFTAGTAQIFTIWVLYDRLTA